MEGKKCSIFLSRELLSFIGFDPSKLKVLSFKQSEQNKQCHVRVLFYNDHGIVAMRINEMFYLYHSFSFYGSYSLQQ